MSQPIIDYLFNSLKLSNPDSSLPTEIINGKLANGPGTSLLGQYPKAIDFDGQGHAVIPWSLNDDLKKLCIRFLISVQDTSVAKQALLEMDGIALHVEAGETDQNFVLTASVQNTVSGLSRISTANRIRLNRQQWYLVDLLYDTDTIGLAIDESMVSLSAFPEGAVKTNNVSKLVIGASKNGIQQKFSGSVAALKIYYNDMPEAVENRLDAQRNMPEWQITYKYNQVKTVISLGRTQGAITYDSIIKAYVQVYENGQIIFNEQLGNTCEMHGAIYQYYKSQPQLKARLGSPVTDELLGKRPGARRVAFVGGGIYWSADTGACAVLANLYVHYERIGESKHTLGLPTALERSVAGGMMQSFQNGHIYWKNREPSAFEVSGQIFKTFQDLGGLPALGFPVGGHEKITVNGSIIGYYCAFEKGNIYDGTSTAAVMVPNGRILSEYLRRKGPKGDLGFPVASAFTLQHGGKTYMCSVFQGGVLVDTGTQLWEREPFRIFIDAVSTKEMEGAFRGENDLYMYLKIKENDVEVLEKRFPSEGDYTDRNVIENIDYNTPMEFTINHPDKKIYIELDIWEEDPGSANEHPGTFKQELNRSNLWGLLLDRSNVFNSGTFQNVNYVKWAIKPHVRPDTPFDFWEVTNRGTAEITKAQFAAALRDIDSEPEWYDPSDWLKELYMHCGKTIADKGNCFGMSTEAVYAWKDISLFSRPLKNVTSWSSIQNEVNIKQTYQLGAEIILWRINQFITNMTKNPKEVFRRSRACYQRGDTPVLDIAQNYKSSGAKHCVLPTSWDDSDPARWRIGVFDPNYKNVIKYIDIDTDTNTYSYKPKAGDTEYGSRIMYMPWSVFSNTPRTPFWEVIALLGSLGLGGIGGALGVGLIMILVAGDDTQTTSLTDLNGNNLDMDLDSGDNVQQKFMRLFGISGETTLNGQLFVNPSGIIAGTGLRHGIKGLKEGELRYGMKQALNEFGLQCPIAKGEQNMLSLEQMATKDELLNYKAGKDKLTTLRLNKKLGSSDSIGVTILNAPAKTNLDLKMGVSPGLRYLDILHGEVMPNMEIVVDAVINNKKSKYAYTARSEGGTRLFLSQAFQQGDMKAASISHIGGSGTQYSILRKK